VTPVVIGRIGRVGTNGRFSVTPVVIGRIGRVGANGSFSATLVVIGKFGRVVRFMIPGSFDGVIGWIALPPEN